MTIPKEKDMPDASSCNVTCSCQSLNCLSHSRAQLEKEVVVAAFRLCTALQKVVIPRHSGQCFNTSIDRKNGDPRHSGQLFNTSTNGKVKRGKKGQLFHFT